jgi:hypothetical protein
MSRKKVNVGIISDNHFKCPKGKELDEIIQKNVFRFLVETEPRNIPFYKLISNNVEIWTYPDLGMSFDTKIMKSILSEKGLC